MDAAKLPRSLLAVGVMIACLYLANGAGAATGARLVSPSVVASSVAGKPITVLVDSFGRGTWFGSAFVGGNEIFLGEDAYRDAEEGGGVGLFILLHETGHTTGIGDEGQQEHAADCFALGHIKGVLRTFWHLRPKQISSRYDDALAWPGKYAGNGCEDLKRKRLAEAAGQGFEP